MIKNLIKESDYSVIKKTDFLYSIFQILVFVFFIIICLRLITIVSKTQVIISDQTSKSTPHRILDVNNIVLAQSIINHGIAVRNYKKMDKQNEIPKLIKDISKFDQIFAGKINETTSNFFHIDRSPKSKKVSEVIYIGNPNIKLNSFLMRDYPFDKYTKNLIGNMNIDNKGLSLIEKTIDEYTNDINLSINIDIQKESYEVLKNDVIRYDANYGLFILVDLLTEEIISNNYVVNDVKKTQIFDPSVMPSIGMSYEFGSVFKTFTVYSALKNDLLSLDEKFNVHMPLNHFSGSKKIRDFIPQKKPLTVKDILKESSNIGAVLINRKLDCKKQFKRDLDSLGLLTKTSVMKGINSIKPRLPKSFSRKGNYCDNLAYGYAMSVTPMHLINAYGKIITGKKKFTANLIKKNNRNESYINNISTKMNQLLFYANKTDHKLYLNCLVAGKTGTADDLSIKLENNKNRKFHNNVTYMSYFPYTNPRYLALTFMNHPKKSEVDSFLTAGNTVKNTFYNIFNEIIFLLDTSSCNKISNKI